MRVERSDSVRTVSNNGDGISESGEQMVPLVAVIGLGAAIGALLIGSFVFCIVTRARRKRVSRNMQQR